MNANLAIETGDLSLDDHSIFLKLWKINDDSPLSFDDLTEEITAAINRARRRKICQCCDGGGMVKGLKCIGGCNGRGYIR